MKNHLIMTRSFVVRFFVIAGLLSFQAPTAAGVSAKAVQPVTASQLGAAGHVLSFQPDKVDLAALDPKDTLTIAPSYAWHTFYGSTNEYENGQGLAVDASGNIYISGYSGANWLGDGGASPLHAYSGGDDIVVVKLNSSGVYQWHTFYGSTQDDYGEAVMVSADGEVYLAGFSYANWQGDGSVNPLHAFSGGVDMMLLKLTSSGAYQWHTFYGSSSSDGFYSLSAERNGNIYLAGVSSASWLGDGGANPLHAHSGSGNSDMALMALNRDGAYQWHTFYGSRYDDRCVSVAVDHSGAIYVAGTSEYTWLGDGGASPLHAHSGSYGYNIAVMKLNGQGAYQWHTFYGSTSGATWGRGLAMDGSGNTYITGVSLAAWQGDGGVEPLHGHSGNGNWDIALLKLTNQGAYQWHTFYGTSDSDGSWNVTVDPLGFVYVSGSSETTWQGDGGVDPLHAHSEGSNADILVLKIGGNGAYQWHTFYGSIEQDEVIGAVIEHNGDILLEGDSYATWQGDGGAEPLHAHSGGSRSDIVVMKLLSPISYIYLPATQH